MPAAEKKFTLTHVVKNACSLEEGKYYYSNPEEYFNTPWKMGVVRKNEYFEFYLCCDEPSLSDWKIDVKLDFQLNSVTGKKLVRNDETDFSITKGVKRCSLGYPQFHKWEDVKNDYMIDGNVIIKAHVIILKMTGIKKKKLRIFDESKKEFSDVVLIVDDHGIIHKFYVSKLFLSSQSTYFEALFRRKFQESGKSEITLKDVDSKDFQNFLELLYGESPIDEDTVEGIVKLADMYDAKLPSRKCEEFLINESEKTLKKKLQMAKQYNLEKLKNECLSKVNTAAEIRSVLSYDTNEMDPSVVGALLQKSLSLIL